MDCQVIVIKATHGSGTDFAGAAEKLAVAVGEQISFHREPVGCVAVGETPSLKSPHLFRAMIERR